MEEEMLRKGIINIRNELKAYLLENKLKSLVIGLSGGIDSAICAVLAKPVCNEIGIPFFGRSLPILTNKKDEIKRAKEMGMSLGLNFKEIDLSESYVALSKGIKENGNETEFESKIREGNIKVRTRMVHLYNLAGLHKGMVLSTDNWSELMLGFWTLHGDVGDYGMIQQLDKTEVYQMAEFLVKDFRENEQPRIADALESSIKAVPTDGLGITNSDLDQIGTETYEEADIILHAYIDNGDKTYENHPVIQRYKRTQFKRKNPFNIPRKKIFN